MADENKTVEKENKDVVDKTVTKPKKQRVYKPRIKSEEEKAVIAARAKLREFKKGTTEYLNANAELQKLTVAWKTAIAVQAQKDLENIKEIAEAAKRDAILKNFYADGFETENDMKTLLEFYKILKSHGITTVDGLKKHFNEG